MCPNGDYTSSYYDGQCGTNPNGAVSTSPSTPSNPSSGGLFRGNPTIGGYAFPGNERIPQKVAAELNFIMTKITKYLDSKAGSDTAKKVRYYKALDAYMLGRYKNTTSERDKQILSYLHTRLGVVSKGLLTGNTSSNTPAPVVQQPIVVVNPTPVQQPVQSTTPAPVQRTPTIELTTPPTVTTPEIDVTTLGINLSNPVLMSYDFTQEKRFPKTVNTVLNSFAENIVNKIEANTSRTARENLYSKTLTALETKAKASSSIKEQKIFQYVKNRVYIRQQENKIGD